MIGIFDSGIGGFCAFHCVKELLPREDIIYLADRKNAPYGTKSEDEISDLCSRNIQKLREMGAKKILIACCTASGIYDRLSPKDREISIPIITPTAKIVAKTAKRIVVIATERTIRSAYFDREIAKYSDSIVKGVAMQELVALVEAGCRDRSITPRCRELLNQVEAYCNYIQADALILGCTHFSHLEDELQSLLPEIKIFSPAKIGAQELAKEILPSKKENGRILYT